MRIVIDYRPALRARTGVGEHIHQVARALTHVADDEITLFSSSWKDRASNDLTRDLPRVRIADRRIPVRALNFAWHRLGWPTIETICGGSFEIAHSPHPLLMPSRSAAQIVTIHDLYFLSHPDQTSEEIRRDYAALAREHARRADRVIVVSRAVAEDVKHRLGVPPERISVCLNGAPDWQTPPARLHADGYLLFVGTLEPRKNIGGLLAAYRRLRANVVSAPRLVIAGQAPPGSECEKWLDDIKQPPLAGHVEYRGYVPPDQREALFKGAQIFLLPSFDEGFGIPALEAMSAGVPVIVSKRGGLPEVVGEAGLLIDPDDSESLAGAMEQMLRDSELRSVCAQRGLTRARQFTWTQTARDVRRAYTDALDARQQRLPALSHAHRH